jgi:tungstate transport system substrate-binding protein
LGAGFDVDTFDNWYRAVGAGMGQALNTAAAMDAHVMSDRASWLNFANKAGLALLYSGDPALFNQYAYLPVNPDKNDNLRHDLALALETWLTSPRAAALINGYSINGETLFVFNATAE